tara:strand:- start:2688 stop:3611 length:924 start_codon:yes stop_codon:yes gene_type:complete
MKTILLTNLMMLAEEKRFVSILEAKGFKVILRRPFQFFDEAACLEMVGEIDGWLAGDDVITAVVLDKAKPRLKVISKWGTGLDTIDLKAAKERGLPVHNTPAAFKDAVAEVALSYMIELARGVIRTDQQIRKGQWPKTPSLGLMGQSLGIIGFGAIGRGVAKRAAAFDMDIRFYDPYFKGKDEATFQQMDMLEDLLEKSQFVCLSCNNSPENYHLMNEARLAMMPKGSYLINVARGPLVKEEALVEAIKLGHISGAGLDVFEVEPLPETSPLRDLDNVLLGSHNANNVVSVVEAVHESTLNNLYKSL